MMRTASILLALAALTSAAHASPPPATSAPADREVISVDNGPGRRLTIVRDAGRDGPTGPAAQPQVLAYTDASGASVRVYADHPVSRSDVQAQIAEAEHKGEQARAQGRLAAEAGRRARGAGLIAAKEGRREAELGRREAEHARAESEQAIKDARHEMEQLRIEEAAEQP